MTTWPSELVLHPRSGLTDRSRAKNTLTVHVNIETNELAATFVAPRRLRQKSIYRDSSLVL